MKHFRILLPLLILILLLSSCGNTSRNSYTVSPDRNRVVTIHPAVGTITYGNATYRYKMKNVWGAERYELTYPDGQRYTWTESKKNGQGAWSEEWKPSIYLDRDFLISALKQPAPESPKYFKDLEGDPVKGVLCIIAGVLLMVFHKHGVTVDSPRRFVRFGSSGRYGTEVSPEEYAAFIFVNGVVLAAAGLILCLI